MEEDLLEAGFEKEMYRIYRVAYTKCKHNAHVFCHMKILVCFVVVAISILQSSDNSYADFDIKLEQILIKTSDELNKQLPMIMDSDTRLDTTLVFKNEIRYLYTLYTLNSAEIDPTLLRKTYESNLINGVCTSENTSKLLKRGGKFIYIYRSKDGKEVLRMSVDKSKCDK